MRFRGPGRSTIDLARANPELRALVESLVDGGEVAVERDGTAVGTLRLTPVVLSGTVHGPATTEATVDRPLRDGVKVVVTTMRLSPTARQRLGDALGADYVVLDFAEAPDSADIVLTHPVSPQLLGRFHLLFPTAHVVVTEIDDPELGIDVTGPVGRLLDAGAQAYLPARPVEKVAENVLAYVAASEQRLLDRGAGPRAGAFLMPPPEHR
jgi:hypothetical protein